MSESRLKPLMEYSMTPIGVEQIFSSFVIASLRRLSNLEGGKGVHRVPSRLLRTTRLFCLLCHQAHDSKPEPVALHVRLQHNQYIYTAKQFGNPLLDVGHDRRQHRFFEIFPLVGDQTD